MKQCITVISNQCHDNRNTESCSNFQRIYVNHMKWNWYSQLNKPECRRVDWQIPKNKKFKIGINNSLSLRICMAESKNNASGTKLNVLSLWALGDEFYGQKISPCFFPQKHETNRQYKHYEHLINQKGSEDTTSYAIEDYLHPSSIRRGESLCHWSWPIGNTSVTVLRSSTDQIFCFYEKRRVIFLRFPLKWFPILN